jgi:hypothetical protein
MTKSKIAVTAFFLIAAMGLAWAYYSDQATQPSIVLGSNLDQSPHMGGTGSDSARIDSQITLKIPGGQADAVYQYLKNKYVAQEITIGDRFPGVRLYGQTMSDVSVFTDEYFDTPQLDLYRGNNSARHRSRVNTTHPNDRKNGRELVQIKVTPPGRFDLRNELKYEVKRSYGQKQDRDDQHQLIGLIKPGERDDFKDVFGKANIDPHSLRHVFTITQTRSRVYINWEEKNILSFSVDQGSARMLWGEGKFASVDVGLVENTYTEADEGKRKIMWEIREAMIKDLVEHFPALTVNSESKYSIVLGQLIKQMGFVPTLMKLGII